MIKSLLVTFLGRRSHVSGDSSSLHPQLQAKSQRFDEKLQKLSVKPSFKRGKSMTRGTPVPQASSIDRKATNTFAVSYELVKCIFKEAGQQLRSILT